MKKVLFFALSLCIVCSSSAQIPNGFGGAYFKDDFATAAEYSNGSYGVFWYANENYQITRPGDSKLRVDVSGGGYSGFGVTFGETNGVPNTLDLTQNGIVKLKVENGSSEEAMLRIMAQDAAGRFVYIKPDTSVQKEILRYTIPGGNTEMIEFDLLSCYAVASWTCMNWPSDCPVLRFDFDWSKVVSIHFVVNEDGQITPFSGSIYFHSIEVGTEPCIAPTQNIIGKSKVCEGESASFTTPSLPEATSYLWTVPADATITYGQGEDSIRVTFGIQGGEVSVTPSNACGDGLTKKLNVAVEHPLGPVDQIYGLSKVCGYRKQVSYAILVVNHATKYNWSLPTGAVITGGNETYSITVDMGNVSGAIEVTPVNGCYVGNTAQKNVEVRTLPEKPVVFQFEDTIVSTEADYYQWYRDGIEIPGAEFYYYKPEVTGMYSVKVSGTDTCVNISDDFFVAVSGINGMGGTYAKDDFSQITEFVNTTTGKGVYWYKSPPASGSIMLNRTGLGKLKVDANYPSGFNSLIGVTFGDTFDVPNTIDLSKDATFHLIVENTSPTDELELRIQLGDINGTYAYIFPDTSDLQKHVVAFYIDPMDTDTIEVDFLKCFAVENWNCMNWPKDCPTLRFDFDYTKVKDLLFFINPNSVSFGGTVYFKDFMLGNFIEQDGSSLTAVDAKGYQWLKDGEEIPGANNKNYTPLSNGRYAAVLTDNDNSLHVSREIEFITTSVREATLDDKFEIYPNPVTDKVRINDLSSSASYSVSIKDVAGKEYNRLVNSPKEISLEAYPQGMYFLEIHSDQGRAVKKIIKQ